VIDLALFVGGLGGSVAVLSGAVALGLRHGIDWDHIAAITDITSATATDDDRAESALTREPGVTFTDESHHGLARAEFTSQREMAPQPFAVSGGGGGVALAERAERSFPVTFHFPEAPETRRAMFLGMLYAIGHGTIVTALGLLAILAAGFLPAEIDPVMERIVGVTLLLLSAYLFYSLWRFYRGGGAFRLRSRWMLVFSAVRSSYRRLIGRIHGEHSHSHVAENQQYGAVTAYSVGLIHGVGAETGTQVLVITAAVGASSDGMAVATLMAFVLGLLVSNGVITFVSSVGFVSASRRQAVYVAAGLVAAVFSLLMGLVFVVGSGAILPSLDPYFRWLGGPE
jgi:hypothetical protein